MLDVIGDSHDAIDHKITILQQEQRLADYRPKLIRFLSTKLADYARVEDIAQDAMVITIEKLRAGKIENICFLEAYLKKTAYYLSIGWLRKKTNQVELRDDIEMMSVFDQDPCITLMKQQVWGSVCLEISALPVVRDKEVLRRYYLHQQSKAEICEFLNLPLSAFDRIISRARRRLKMSDAIQYHVACHDC